VRVDLTRHDGGLVDVLTDVLLGVLRPDGTRAGHGDTDVPARRDRFVP
jgi:hypothetical protein